MNQRRDVQALSAGTCIEINYRGFLPENLIIGFRGGKLCSTAEQLQRFATEAQQSEAKKVICSY